MMCIYRVSVVLKILSDGLCVLIEKCNPSPSIVITDMFGISALCLIQLVTLHLIFSSCLVIFIKFLSGNGLYALHT